MKKKQLNKCVKTIWTKELKHSQYRTFELRLDHEEQKILYSSSFSL